MKENTKITSNEYKILKSIQNYVEKNIWLPSLKDLESILRSEYSYNSISNYLSKLKEKGLVKNHKGNLYTLTDRGHEYLQELEEEISRYNMSVNRTILWIRGEVKAGKSRPDDLVVDLSPYDADTSEVIYIPNNVESTSKVFVLKVVGRSMEEEGIKVGDYILVKEFTNIERARDIPNGSLIVAKYIPYFYKDIIMEDGQISADDMHGPTLKYYYKTLDEEGNIVHILSSAKKDKRDRFHFKVLDIFPIGEVIGVYRDLS